VLTPAMFRNRSYDCQTLAERAPNARVRDPARHGAHVDEAGSPGGGVATRELPPTPMGKEGADEDRRRVMSSTLPPPPASPRELRILEARLIARSQPFRDIAFHPHLTSVLEQDGPLGGLQYPHSGGHRGGSTAGCSPTLLCARCRAVKQQPHSWRGIPPIDIRVMASTSSFQRRI
jgi:hypothetical protein